MKQKDETLYFSSDAEFENFCVASYAVVKESESGIMYVEECIMASL